MIYLCLVIIIAFVAYEAFFIMKLILARRRCSSEPNEANQKAADRARNFVIGGFIALLLILIIL